jgi:hypothetical protein
VEKKLNARYIEVVGAVGVGVGTSEGGKEEKGKRTFCFDVP